MTADYLLDAVGLIDDDLIAQAEEPLRARRPAPGGWLRRWGGSLAACLAVAAALGWVLGRGGAANSGSSAANGTSAFDRPAASAPAGSGRPESESSGGNSKPEDSVGTAEAPQQPAAGSASGGTQEIPSGTVFVGSSTYSLTRYVEELPEGASLAGVLSRSADGAPGPSTTAAEYAGLDLWISEDGSSVYAALPGGGFAQAELVQP